jgi:uncharacterized protein (DUF1501 family)
MIVNRREFLRRSLHTALGGVGLYTALGNLKVMAAAANLAAKGGVFNDYKALVCVFLHGGNDSFNTIVPCDQTTWNIYNASRPAMAIDRLDALALQLAPQAPHQGFGVDYGLHPSMPQMRDLFNAQNAAIVANVGPLRGPITKAQYQATPGLAPPQLFSHDDQANFWQTSRPDDANADGWGGRIADMLYAGNPNPDLPMTMSLQGQSLFQRGSTVDQYVMKACDPNPGGGCGVERIGYLGEYQNELGTATFNALMASGTQSHMFERAYAGATRRAISTYETLGSVLGTLPTWTTAFPNTGLGAQLRQVANLINVRNTLNMRRQIFFVGIGGFDTHDTQLAVQSGILGDLSQSMHAFYNATVQMGIANEVTAFTASDFGRTLSTNGDGTDHGWGGHHFVVGGAVQGGRYFGTMPSLLQNGNPDDAGYGQFIPTTGVDQYAATLATWFGVPAADIGTLFPGLVQYDYATDNLGFMA